MFISNSSFKPFNNHSNNYFVKTRGLNPNQFFNRGGKKRDDLEVEVETIAIADQTLTQFLVRFVVKITIVLLSVTNNLSFLPNPLFL